MSDFAQCVEQCIVTRQLIRPGESVLVAVSGGLDSMALLHLLAQLAAAAKWRLTVAHFNHQLRGRSSDADERLVRETAKHFGLPFVSGRGDVKRYSRARGLSLEMAARKLRHEFFAKMAAKRGIKTIALAHHADDQVELFFLRLLRGAGSEGLAGMKWRSPSPADPETHLIRPLLDQPKAVLQAWATERRIAFREDASNACLDIQRNRIRAELIPLLTKHYQPALSRVILRGIEVLGAETEFLNRMAADWLKGRGEPFEKLPVALQRRCLQLQLSALGVAATFEMIEQLREAADESVDVRCEIALYRDSAGNIRIREIRPNSFVKGQKRLILKARKGELTFSKTRVYWELKRLDSGTFRAAKRAVAAECFDARKVGTVIFLRHWRPGDRFQPLGLASPVKLQDLFMNQRVPRAERHRRLVATTAKGEIFWVEGLRMAERFKLDTTTTHGLKWQWQGL